MGASDKFRGDQTRERGGVLFDVPSFAIAEVKKTWQGAKRTTYWVFGLWTL